MTSQGPKIPSQNKLIQTFALKSLKITLKRIHKQISGDFNGIGNIYQGILGPPGKKYTSTHLDKNMGRLRRPGHSERQHRLTGAIF